MHSQYLKDLVERVVTTFVAAFVSVLVATGPMNLGDLSVWQSAAAAGGAAVVSLLKGFLAKNVGDRNTASLRKF
jgi:hypothetical protein